MADHSRTLRKIRLLITGTVLMLTVSLAAAAIVMWIPESPVRVERDQQIVGSLSEYVLLHRARNAVVPPYVQVDVDDSVH